MKILFFTLTLFLASCFIDTENENFRNELIDSNFYTCPVTKRVLTICEIKWNYPHLPQNSYSFGDVVKIPVTPTPPQSTIHITFYLNDTIKVDRNNMSYNVFEVTQIPSNSLYSPTTSLIQRSYLNLTDGDNFIKYDLNLSSGGSPGDLFIVKLLSYSQYNRDILNDDGIGILEEKEIMFIRY